MMPHPVLKHLIICTNWHDDCQFADRRPRWYDPIVTWWRHPAEWWQFWWPQSGPASIFLWWLFCAFCYLLHYTITSALNG